MQSCKYDQYLRYYFPNKKTHFPHFSKWAKFVGSNNNVLRSCYNISCYDWYVSIHPEKKMINGLMKISFSLNTPQDSIILDLQKQMVIKDIKSSVPLKKWKRKKDILFFVFTKQLQQDEKVTLEISYQGTPIKVFNYTVINWKKDKNNNPWVCTTTQGIGPHHMMPCKLLLNDEPDSCFIRVGTPKKLFAVANGKLDGITETSTEKIYNWSVKNPINIYNISFNVGDYAKIEKDYTDVNLINHKIDIYALNYNKLIADTFYNQTPILLKNFEKIYGLYPWWSDGCKIVESCLPSERAMEHQSAISMGKDYAYNFYKYNLTLAHELAHEWWGNSVSAYDYGDLWLHEGFALYSEFLTVEAIFNKNYYNYFVNSYSTRLNNARPVLKPYNVLYNSLVDDDDTDIYAKGALLLHTLRMQLNNDELFFSLLKKIQIKFAKSNITTDQFISFFNSESHLDFTPYFDVYLTQISPPEFEYFVVQIDSESAILNYKWKREPAPNFSMKMYADIKKTSFPIYPSINWQKLKIPAQSTVKFDIAKFGYVLIKNVKPVKIDY
jgi:aminopeptidase N